MSSRGSRIFAGTSQELMASLNLQSTATQLSAPAKRPRAEPKNNSEKQPRTQRRSLRTRGLSPEKKRIAGANRDGIDNVVKTLEYLHHKVNPRKLGPLSMRDVYSGVSDRALIDTILGASGVVSKKEEDHVEGDLKVESLAVNENNVAWVVPGNAMNIKFLPTSNLRMVVVGNMSGNVGFWNIEFKEGEDGGIYLYRPHSSPISDICVHQHCMSKIFTCSHDQYNNDGFIQSMDAEKEVFDLVYASDRAIYSLAQQSNNAKCLYFAEGNGGISMWDERTGNISHQWSLHHGRINSIDFNSENSNIMTTSSSDRTSCIWDLRCSDADKLKSLKTIDHERVVYSAYFSPSGRSLVTTSLDSTVGISTGVNFEDVSMIQHDNNTSLMFKAIWGWDDSYVFVGNKNRGVDIISPLQRRTIFSIQSPNVSAVPSRLAAHPYNVGMLAGATGRGQVYVWTVG